MGRRMGKHRVSQTFIHMKPLISRFLRLSINILFILLGRNEFGKKANANTNLIRLQTLYHADKKKMDGYILELVTWLHRLIYIVRYRDNAPKALPTKSPTRKGLNLHVEMLNNNGKTSQLSLEDRNLLEEVMRRRKMVPGRSKSQEFAVVGKKKSKVWAISRSTGSSPRRVDHPKATNSNVLDILDGLDTSFSSP